eukprot:CAMPEP_0114673108 /NCGR_PEP_ID=MMETSP0191-20121206/44129_1 /TAXON_ID=126664 /ORGANISM="Sorites sp." /LENGTH=194 /DNA_ID=CAMNT_0001937223 /DNA_START=310 /DNA_END=891 /DNA_ORIENTATION=+
MDKAHQIAALNDDDLTEHKQDELIIIPDETPAVDEAPKSVETNGYSNHDNSVQHEPSTSFLNGNNNDRQVQFAVNNESKINGDETANVEDEFDEDGGDTIAPLTFNSKLLNAKILDDTDDDENNDTDNNDTNNDNNNTINDNDDDEIIEFNDETKDDDDDNDANNENDAFPPLKFNGASKSLKKLVTVEEPTPS